MNDLLNIYVCNPMGDILYCLDDIDKTSVSLTERLNGQWELSFKYTRRNDTASNAFDVLEEGMYLYVENKGHFKMRQPSVHMTAASETKDVRAYSCDVELEDYMITFPVNMGTETSLEFLLQLDEEETELVVNPYTGIPYDWVVLYNTYPQQIAKLQHILSQRWVDQSVAFEIDDTDEDFAYISQVLTQIPRLCSRAEAASERIGASLTVAAVTGDDDVAASYTLEQYVALTKNADGDTTSITFEPSFTQRMSDMIVFYQTYGDQLSLLDIICRETGHVWAPGDIAGYDPTDVYNSDYHVANMRYQFDIDESIYSFLTTTYAQRSKCLVSFDILHRRINVTPADLLGADTGIVLSYDNLLNGLQIQANEDTLATRVTVYGSDSLIDDDLSIEQVNFGEGHIVDIDYKLNARGRDGRRIYVTDDLAEKYARYHEYRETVARPEYVEQTRTINAARKQISELKYRLPADSMQNDWDAMTDEELETQLKYYTNMLYALQELYAADYGYTYLPIGEDTTPWVNLTQETSYRNSLPDWITTTSDSNVIPRTEVIQDTMYWWDYVAYRQTITQIRIAIQARYDAGVDYRYSSIPETNEWYQRIHAWETQWDLYGAVELQNKIAAYTAQLQTMIDGDAVIVVHKDWDELTAAEKQCFRYPDGSEFDEACRVLQRRKTWDKLGEQDRQYFDGWRISSDSYVTLCNANIVEWEAVPWDDLSDRQKAMFGGMETGYFYTTYKEIYDRRVSAEDALADRQDEIAAIEDELEQLQAERTEMAQSIQIEKFVHPDTGETFSEYDVKVLHLLYRDADYTNEYILTTSLDDIVTAVDKLEELYADAIEQVRVFSRPQLTFSAETDNLLSLAEFEPLVSQFKLGNYIYVEYRDGTNIRMRMIACTYNPCTHNKSLTIEFSTLTQTKTKVSDVESMLGMAQSTTSSRGGGSASGGGGTYGDLDDLGVTLSDTMLRKLLTRESFNKEVSASVQDAMRQQASMSQIAVFQGLKDGVSAVSGNCIRAGRIASEATCEVTYWTPFYKLPPELQDLFGWAHADDYNDAIQVMKLFIIKYGETWYNMSDTERNARLRTFWIGLSTYQKDLFSHSEVITNTQDSGINIITTFLSDTNRGNVYRTEPDRPVSDLALDEGAFSYGGGSLKYNYDGESIQYVPETVDGYYYNNCFYGDEQHTVPYRARTNVAYHDLTEDTKYVWDNNQNLFVEVTGDIGAYQNAWRPILFMRGRIDASEGTLGGVKILPRSFRQNGQVYLHDAGLSVRTPSDSMNLGTMQYGDRLRLEIHDLTNSSPDTIGDSPDYVFMQSDKISLVHRADGTYATRTWCELSSDGSIDASGAIACGSLSSTGSVSASGSMSAASATVDGDITAANVNATGTISSTTVVGNSEVGSYLSSTRIYTKYGYSQNAHTGCITAQGAAATTYSELRTNGDIYASSKVYAGSTQLTGGDYAEYFEWIDGNPSAEDRRGRFVTLDGEQIRLANHDDVFILGITSSQPSVVGNTAHDAWHNKYLCDEFGAVLTQAVTYDAIVDDDGNVVEESHVEYEPILNPDFDPALTYTPRSERSEWAPIGMVGQMIMLDDGTCEVNGFATSADHGIATKAGAMTNYRVMKRIDSNHILVAAK